MQYYYYFKLLLKCAFILVAPVIHVLELDHSTGFLGGLFFGNLTCFFGWVLLWFPTFLGDDLRYTEETPPPTVDQKYQDFSGIHIYLDQQPQKSPTSYFLCQQPWTTWNFLILTETILSIKAHQDQYYLLRLALPLQGVRQWSFLSPPTWPFPLELPEIAPGTFFTSSRSLPLRHSPSTQ